MAPKKRTTRASPAITTTTTTPLTNAQLKALIDQGVADALAARDADRSLNGDDSHNSGTGNRRTERTARECTGTDIKEMDIIKEKNGQSRTREGKKASDTLGSHAGNPQQSHWLKNVSRDPTAKRLRIEGSYEWRAEIRGLRSVSGSRIISTSL
ncbi:hypothetical protein Tco_1184983 [Tanacetum coccineum]